MEVICCLLLQDIRDFSDMKEEAEISCETLVFA
jgi:hypothetical protein